MIFATSEVLATSEPGGQGTVSGAASWGPLKSQVFSSPHGDSLDFWESFWRISEVYKILCLLHFIADSQNLFDLQV